MVYKDKCVFKGTWSNDKEVRGTMKWPQSKGGDTKKGDFSFGGEARYEWSNGDYYEGPWENNKREGKGVTVYIKERNLTAKYDGDYSDNKRDG